VRRRDGHHCADDHRLPRARVATRTHDCELTAPGDQRVSRADLVAMDSSEIEYIDSVDQRSSLQDDTIDRPVPGRSRFSTLLGVAGWLIFATAVAVAIGLSVTYRSTQGDPMRPAASGYVSERGVPPAADLLLGMVGVVLGLSLVAFARLVENSTTSVTQLAAITRLLTEQHHEPNASQETADPHSGE
jgi:hypothetical protein